MVSATTPLDAGVNYAPPDAPRVDFPLRVLAPALLVACAYWLTAWAGMRLPFPGAHVSILWFANAVLLGALLLAPRRTWWVYLVACFPAHLLLVFPGDDAAIRRALILYTGNCTTALIAAFGLLAVVPDLRRDRVHTTIALLVIGGVLVPAATSLLMSMVFLALDYSQTFWLTVIARTLTNSFAILTLVPLILCAAAWVRGGRIAMLPARIAEGGLLAVSLLTSGIVAFIAPPAVFEHSAALLFAPFAVLLWAAARFDVAGSCASVLALGVLAIIGLLNQTGPFVSHVPYQSAASLLLFLS